MSEAEFARAERERTVEVIADAAAGDPTARAKVAVAAWARGENGAADSLRVLALGGQPEAARTLATAFQVGQGVEPNADSAASWLRVAADLGDPTAQRELDVFALHRGETSP